MNTNSYICRFISDHPEDWEDILVNDYMIKVKRDDDHPLAIFNYNMTADFSDPIVQEARGIIIDYGRKDVVCFPFRKFGNYHESYVDDIDWNSARVLEKVDGSIIKLWYNEYKGAWQFSTNSCIDAASAFNPANICFMDMIKETDEYKNIFKDGKDFSFLDRCYSYIFELVAPDNQIVVKYDDYKLYHLGTRGNLSGEECEVDLGIDKPKPYDIHSLDGCIEAAKELNEDGAYPDNEGFVVVDKDYHRIKVKSPLYLVYHHMSTTNRFSMKDVYDILMSDDYDEEEVAASVPKLVNATFEKCKEIILSGRNDVNDVITQARKASTEGLTRKEIALMIRDNPYSTFGFKALDDKEATPQEILNNNIQAFINIAERLKKQSDLE